MAHVRMKALTRCVEGAQRPKEGECFNVPENRVHLYESQNLARRCECNGACQALPKPVQVSQKKAEEFTQTDDPNLLWDKKISPEEYLEKFPDARAAELARRIVEYNKNQAEAGAAADGSEADDTNSEE